jgi:hypothetical protein
MPIVSALDTDNVIGRVYSIAVGGDGEQFGTVGGAAANFGGILINPKTLANFAGVNPSFYINNGSIGELLSMGIVCVAIGTVSTVFDVPKYNTTTGEITGVGAPGVGEAAIPGAVVWATDSAQTADADGNYIALIKLTN